MSEWNDLAHWMYADVRSDRGFWYAHPLHEVSGLSEEQLYWVPDENCLCMLWHVGHIAHRERLHIGRFLQGLDGQIIPPRHEVFGAEWCPVRKVRDSVDSIDDVFNWVEDVRGQSIDFVRSLPDEDWHREPETSEFGLTNAHWVFLTVAHGALHLGRIQMMRAMLEDTHDRPC
jgi:hypothetical protein